MANENKSGNGSLNTMNIDEDYYENFFAQFCGDAPNFLKLDYFAATVFVIGVIGNVITIVKIDRDRRLHRPVYILLQSLAVADLMSLIVLFVLKWTHLQDFLRICRDFYEEDLYTFLIYTVQHASAAHIVFLTGYRLVLVLRPLHSNHAITNGRIRLGSALIWLVSVLIATIFTVSKLLLRKYIEDSTVAESKRFEVELAYMGYSSLVAVLVLVFHIIKLRTAERMRGSRIEQNSGKTQSTYSFVSLTKSTRRRMTIIVTIIVVFYIVPCICEVVFFSLKLHGKLVGAGTSGDPLNVMTDKANTASSYSWLINYAVNPIIYFFFSKMATEILCSKCS